MTDENMGSADRDLLWAAPTGAAIVVALVGCFALVAAGGWKWFSEFLRGSASGWAQAILASLAIGLTAYIARSTERKNQEKEENQRARDFRANQAFLPEALRQLSNYLRQSAIFLNAAWLNYGSRPSGELPTISPEVAETFRECIRFAPAGVGDYLAQILRALQVHRARLEQLDEPGVRSSAKLSVMYYMYDTAELQVMVDHLFSFARSEVEALEPLRPDSNAFDTAYRILRIQLHAIRLTENDTLRAYTQRKLSSFDQ